MFNLYIFWDFDSTLSYQNSTLNGPQQAGFEMADLKKFKKVCGTTRASASRLIARYKDILQENYEDQEDENGYIRKFKRQAK